MHVVEGEVEDDVDEFEEEELQFIHLDELLLLILGINFPKIVILINSIQFQTSKYSNTYSCDFCKYILFVLFFYIEV